MHKPPNNFLIKCIYNAILAEVEQHFLKQLNNIANKKTELQKNGHTTAANCAEKLHKDVNDAYHNLKAGTINFLTFKTNCLDAIKAARPELEKHRGWKQVLGNLALAVIGMGVLYVIAGLIHKAVTGNFLFFKTDSANKIDRLAKTIDSMKPVSPLLSTN